MKRKRCSKCKIRKPATLKYFHRNGRYGDGLHKECRDCRSIAKKNFYLKNRNRINKQIKEHYANNRNTIRNVYGD